MKNSKLLLIVLIAMIAFSSCNEDDTFNPNANGEMVLNYVENGNSTGLKNKLQNSEPVALLISIKNSVGEYVFLNERIELYKMNNEFMSSPISLIVGEYELTDFLVIDNSNNILYAAPKEGSEMAYLVNNPLSIKYEISEDNVTKITPEVISTENISPEDFGYNTFGFDIVETISFLTTVFVYNESLQNFELTDASILIKINSDTLFNNTLDAVTNLITINSNYDNYNIIISKSGYVAYNELLTKDSLLKHFSNPLTIILEENYYSLVLQPDAAEGKDAVFSLIVPDNNYGDSEDIHPYAWSQGGMLNVNRVAIDFDLSVLPSDAQIDSAFISLYFNNTSSYGEHYGDNSFVIQRIISEWDESTITWNTQPSTSQINKVIIEAATTPTQDFTHLNITELICDIVDDIDNSFGMLLKLETEEIYKRLTFASSDNANENIRPKLEIYYRTNE